MQQNKNLQQGFSFVEVLVVLFVVGLLVLAGWLALGRGGSVNPEEKQQQAASKRIIDPGVIWDYGASGWQVTLGTAPSCPQPYTLVAPADLTQATAVWYPGQGESYRTHGGLKFDGQVPVASPIDGYVYRGSSTTSGGQTLYTIDILDPCGVLVRLGQLTDLTNKYQLVADKFPKIERGVIVRAGEKIANGAGLAANATLDVGVYDLRTTNRASESAEYRQKHAADTALALHGVCWIDWLSASNEDIMKSLPTADATSGKQSDYCVSV